MQIFYEMQIYLARKLYCSLDKLPAIFHLCSQEEQKLLIRTLGASFRLCLCACVCACVFFCACVHMYVCVCVYIVDVWDSKCLVDWKFVCVCVCIYIYINIV